MSLQLQNDVAFGDDNNSPENYNKRLIKTVNEQSVKLVKLYERIRLLEKALKPFAQFACSEKNSCKCNNCIARDLLDT